MKEDFADLNNYFDDQQTNVENTDHSLKNNNIKVRVLKEAL